MKIEITLVEPEEHLVADFDARDRRAFERVGCKDIGLTGPALIDGNPRMPESQLAWIGWHALRRDNQIDMPWLMFEARCAQATAVTDDDDAGLGDPTGPAR